MRFLPELFFAVRLLYSVRDVKYQLVMATGNFKGSSYIAITEMTINVVSSIILVFFYGIYGVLIGTIVALIYSCIAYHLYTNKKILRIKPHYGVIVILSFLFTAFLIGFFGMGLIPEITNYKMLILVAIPVGISVLLIYLLLAAGCIWKQRLIKIESAYDE